MNQNVIGGTEGQRSIQKRKSNVNKHIDDDSSSKNESDSLQFISVRPKGAAKGKNSQKLGKEAYQTDNDRDDRALPKKNITFD